MTSAVVTTPQERGWSTPEWVMTGLLLAVFVLGVVSSTALPGAVQLTVVAGFLITSLLLPLAHRSRAGADLGAFLLVPTIISASQNLYLLPVASELGTSQFQVVIVLNFLFAVCMLAVTAAARPETRIQSATGADRRRLTTLVAWPLIALSAYGAFTVVLFDVEPTAALASYRNLVTPLLFTIIGLVAARSTGVRPYTVGLVALGVAVVLFGFVEDSVPGFWQNAGLEPLWNAKGLSVASSTGVPPNFYSSELIGDSPVRRMVSSFADPVHFGTFLFAAFMGAWYLRRRLLMVLFLVAAALAVSKGAFLSVLVFVAVWTWRAAPRWAFTAAVVAVAGAGVLFYGFSLDNSTGSTTTHVDGLLAAFTELPSHPLGRGLGNIGVLASLFHEGSESEIRETGLGMVIGQLGVVGLAAYIAFFTVLIRRAVRLPGRRSTFALALLLGFLANASFNEVAMSPNSAAPYFVLVGLLLGAPRPARVPDVDEPTTPKPLRPEELTPWN